MTAIELRGKQVVYEVSDAQMLEYEQMFPNINVAQQLCSMRVWLEANDGSDGGRDRRPKNVKRFIANWLIGETRKFESDWNATHRESRVGR